MTQDQAIVMLRNAYKYVLYLRADELPAYVWSRTLGTLQMAIEDVRRQAAYDRLHCAQLLDDFKRNEVIPCT
jgi:hypothetical protein